MSHSVSFTVDVNFLNNSLIENLKVEISHLDDFLKANQQISTNFCTQIQNVKSEIQMAIDDIINFANQKIETNNEETENAFRIKYTQASIEYQRKVESILKRIANIKNSLNYINELNQILESDQNQVHNFIYHNGYAGYMSYKNLISNNVMVTEDNLNAELERIKYLETITEEIKNYKKFNFEYIKGLDIPEEYKYFFYQQNKSFTTISELSDFLAFVESFQNKWNERKIILNETDAIMKKLGFQQVESIKKIWDSNAGKDFGCELKYKNKMRNSITVFYNILKGEMEYKMGNYTGHLCEKDSAAFLESLANKFVISKPRIIREISNDRPLFMQRECNSKQGER